MADPARVAITHRAPDRQWLLHAHPEAAAALGAATGLALGTAMLRAEAADGGWDALHLSPDEWLLIGKSGDEIVARFEGVSIAHSLVDVSERTLGRLVTGRDAAAVLAGGCALDLERMRPGDCTRTLFGKVTVLLWRQDDGWRLDFARSYEGYVDALLAAAAAGAPVSA